MANKNFPKKPAQQKPPAKPQPAQQQKGPQPQAKPATPGCCGS